MIPGRGSISAAEYIECMTKSRQLIEQAITVSEAGSKLGGKRKPKKKGVPAVPVFLCSATGNDHGFAGGDIFLARSYDAKSETAVDAGSCEYKVTVYDAEKIDSLLDRSKSEGAKFICTADGEGGYGPGEIFLASSYDEEAETAVPVGSEEPESVFTAAPISWLERMVRKGASD